MQGSDEARRGPESLWASLTAEDDAAGNTATRARPAILTHIKSGWVLSSIAGLREAGHYEAYTRELDERTRTQLLCLGPSEWVPVYLASAHYQACDKLGLPAAAVLAMGKAVMARASRSELRLLAGGGAVEPMTMLMLAKQLWKRSCRGGRVHVAATSERSADFVVEGHSLAVYTYCRLGWRGVTQGLLDHSGRRGTVQELETREHETTLALRVQWS